MTTAVRSPTRLLLRWTLLFVHPSTPINSVKLFKLVIYKKCLFLSSWTLLSLSFHFSPVIGLSVLFWSYATLIITAIRPGTIWLYLFLREGGCVRLCVCVCNTGDTHTRAQCSWALLWLIISSNKASVAVCMRPTGSEHLLSQGRWKHTHTHRSEENNYGQPACVQAACQRSANTLLLFSFRRSSFLSVGTWGLARRFPRGEIPNSTSGWSHCVTVTFERWAQ